MAASTATADVAEIEAFVAEYYRAWQGTDEDLIMSFYAEDVTLHIPGTLMRGAPAVREQFVRPFITAFPGNRHFVNNIVHGPGVAVVEFTFDAQHTGPFAGRAATGAHVEIHGCGVYEYDLARRRINSARIYFDLGSLLKQILDEHAPPEAERAPPAGAMAPVEPLDLAKVIAVSRAVSRKMVLERLIETLQLWNVSQDLLVIAGLDGTMLSVNPAWTATLGWWEADLLGRSYEWLLHPDDRERTCGEVGRLVTGHTMSRFECRLRARDGSYHWISWNAAPDGQRLYGMGRDVTEHRRAEQALRESERESRLIVNTIPGLVAVLTPSGAVDAMNDQLLEYCGQGRDAMPQWDTNGMVHPEDVPGVAAVFAPAIAAGVPYDFEARIRRFDGVYRWLQCRGLPFRDTQGQIARWYVLLSDIDDRKHAEVELRQAYDSFVDAQRLSKTGSFITDLVGDDHNWSEEAYRIFEFDRAAPLTVQRVREVIHPDDLPGFESMITRAMTGMDVNFAFRIVTSRGALKHVRGVAHVIGQNAGRPMFVGAMQDVTETVVKEEALTRLRAELAHVSRLTTMGELTASIAHEVKQPIAAAVTSAQTALRWLDAQPPELGEVRESLARIVRAGMRAGDVIGRIRALVTKAPPAKVSVDVNAAIREVVELTRGEAVRNGVTVRTELAEGVQAVPGDRVQLQQVILNLIVNGIEAMAGGGEGSRDLLIRSRTDEAEGVLVVVADSGPGLAAEGLEQAFAAFYTTKPGGLGLGLSICRSIVEAHDGRLWASHNEPRGAVFQFTLPAPPG